MYQRVNVDCNLCKAYDFEVVYNQTDASDDISSVELWKSSIKFALKLFGKKFNQNFAQAFFKSLKAYPKLVDMYGASQSVLSQDCIVRCKRCGLIYVNPRLSDGSLKQAYMSGKQELYFTQNKSKILTFLDSLEWVERFVPVGDYLHRGKILDIGTASGLFMGVAEQNGWEAHGVEPNTWLAEYARDRLHLNVYNNFLEDVSLPSDSFDAVTMWDVIEHLPDPKGTLLKIHDSIVDGGYLFFTTPDFNCVFSKMLRRRWWFVMTHHIYYFTPETIKNILEQTGFELVDIKRHFGVWNKQYISDMIASLGKSKPDDIIIKMLLFVANWLPIKKVRMYAGQIKVAARKR